MHLIHDKAKSHMVLVEKLKLSEEKYDSREIKKLADKDNPLNPLVTFKKILRSHSGLDTAHL